VGHVCCHNGLADFSKTQAHHPNAQPLRWLRAARRTRTKKPRCGGAKSGLIEGLPMRVTANPPRQYHTVGCTAQGRNARHVTRIWLPAALKQTVTHIGL
jgi:hypothetical protein